MGGRAVKRCEREVRAKGPAGGTPRPRERPGEACEEARKEECGRAMSDGRAGGLERGTTARVLEEKRERKRERRRAGVVSKSRGRGAEGVRCMGGEESEETPERVRAACAPTPRDDRAKKVPRRTKEATQKPNR